MEILVDVESRQIRYIYDIFRRDRFICRENCYINCVSDILIMKRIFFEVSDLFYSLSF